MKNKKRDDLINKGRHEIADPVSKKIGQISESMVSCIEEVYDHEKETLGIVKDLAVEIKDENLKISRICSFSDLLEEHDIVIVSKLITKYCSDALNGRREYIDQFVQGINEAVPVGMIHEEELDYELLEKLDDKAEASVLLFEMICLCNALCEKEYDAEIYKKVLTNLTISQKRATTIESYFSSHHSDYSISKWVGLFLNGYKADVIRGEGTFSEETAVDFSFEGLRRLIRESMSVITNSKIRMPILNMVFKYDYEDVLEDAKGFINTYNRHIEYKTIVYYYEFDRVKILFTTWGIHVIDGDTYKTTTFSMSYKKFDEEKSKIAQPKREGEKYLMTVCSYDEKAVRIPVDRDEGKTLRHLFLKLKEVDSAKNDVWFSMEYLSRDNKKLYGEILVDFLNLFGYENMEAVRYFNRLAPARDDLKEIVEYSKNSKPITREALIEKVTIFLTKISYPCESIISYIFVSDVIGVLQYASHSSRTMTLNEESFVTELCRLCHIDNADRFIELARVPYRVLQKDIDFGEISGLYRAIRQEMNIPYELIREELVECWGLFETIVYKLLGYLNLGGTIKYHSYTQNKYVKAVNDILDGLNYIGKLGTSKQKEEIDKLSESQLKLITDTYISVYGNVKTFGDEEYLERIVLCAEKTDVSIKEYLLSTEDLFNFMGIRSSLEWEQIDEMYKKDE